MNAVVQPAIRALVLAPGDTLVLADPHIGHRIEAGEIELYASLAENGQPASRRLFLFKLRTEDLIIPGLCSNETVIITALAAEAASLIPVSTTFLQQSASSPDRGPPLAVRIEQWLAGLGDILAPVFGAVPSDTVTVEAGARFETRPGSAFTGRGTTGWIAAKDADLSYPDGETIAMIDGAQTAPLLPGVWVRAGAAADAIVVPTAAALQQPAWLRILHSQHVYVLAELERKLRADQSASADLSFRRHERTTGALERTMGRFAGVLDHAPAWTGAAATHEQWLGPFTLVCEVLGIDLNRVQRDAIAKAATMEDAARSSRLRQRQIALRGAWWRDDFGPFIGFLDEARRPCAVLPAGAGRMRLVDPGGGRDRVVDASVAARLMPMAHMLYRPFAARPLRLKDVIGLGWKQSAGDIAVAVMAAFAMSLLGLATPLAMRLAFDRFIPSHETVPLIELAVGLALAALITTAFRLAYDAASLRIDGRMAGATQAAMVDRVLRLPAIALRFGAADLAQRIIAVDSVRKTAVNFGLTSIASLFALVMNGALLVYYAPLGALVAWGFLVLLLLTAWLTSIRQSEALRRGEELLSNVNTIIFHFIQGIGVLRAAGAEARAFARWGRDFAEMRARAYRSQSVATTFETALAGCDILSMAGVFLVLSTMSATDLSIGSFISFVAAYGVFMGSAIQLARGLTGLLNSKVSWERAAPLLKATPEGNVTKRDPGVLTGAIEITNAVFKYGPDLPYVLSGLSLRVRAGEFVAFVGASGSGKSTIMQMLLGNRIPLAGTVQYDDVDLSHLDMDLVRRQIGVVLQNGRLLPGTIFENIMGAHHGSLEDAWEAARQAGLDTEIKALPMGMHTILTEATAAFSGGQVQRIMLARALAGRPRILLLDEATSALDNTTQAIVTASLAKLAVTRVVIAHRLVTVKQADRICVIDGGRVAQSGSYAELMAGKGLFTELARRQLL